MFNCKEQVTHHIVTGHIHLSKKDYGFFSNVNNMCKENRPVTSNQNKLFDKLLDKYKKQLTKLNLDILQLQNLPWQVGVIISKQEFLEAKISIKDNYIIIKSPFNTKFIQQFRKVFLNKFVWNKEHKYYSAPFSTHNLKIAVYNVKKYYSEVNYCNQTNEILNQLKQYEDVKYWEPTLVKSNNNFYIFGLNEHLHKAINHIELKDDPNTLFELTQYGIKIDDTVTNQSRVLQFAGNYNVQMDLELIEFLCKVLLELKVDHVFTARNVVYNKDISNEIMLLLLKYGISCSPISSNNLSERAVLLKMPTDFDSHNSKICKKITLTNSRPIKIK